MLAGLVGLAPGRVLAQGIATPFHGAEAEGEGGAVIAKQGLLSAPFSNPAIAGVTQGARAYVGLMTFVPSTSVRDAETGQTDSTNFAVYPLPHVHLAFTKGKVGATFYAGVPFGLGASFAPNWPGRYEATDGALVGMMLSPNITFSPVDGVALAGGVYFAKARFEVARQADLVTQEATGAMAMNSDWALGATASAFAKLSKPLSIGLSYRSGTNFRFAGEADFDGATPEFESLLRDQSVRTEVPIAHTVSAGVYYLFDDRLSAGFSADYSTWSQLDKIRMEFDNPALDTEVDMDWGNGVGLYLGGQYKVRRQWHARLGTAYVQAMSPANRLMPGIPEGHRVLGALGGRYLGQTLLVDAAYAFGYQLPRDSEPPAYPGTYGGHIHMIALSFGYAPSGFEPAPAVEDPIEQFGGNGSTRRMGSTSR